MNNFTTKQLTTGILIMLLIFFVELTFFNNGGAFFLILGAFFLYRSFSKGKKIYFWIGALFFFIALLTIWSLRLFIVCILIYILYKNATNQHKETAIQGEHFEQGMIQKNDLLLPSSMPPMEHYKWQDILIQNFLGDYTIDATETILPSGTSVITIRQGIGKVTIILPYEIPFKLQYSTLIGEAKLLDYPPKRLWNERITFEDGNPVNSKRKLVIHVATWLGDVEVIRK
ncbi:cell wall-active antibiotics response protein LiaF [Ureibacillus thermophilus]|uniref:Cell wall-active antibiotics response LiaF-like C-terminal domain-containing protein n=1 Tax=Ureibacillus thermophilus TaxID=367743 RepID=A0A4P6UR64_9BACL|nr:cell wall-active antibiotics response protein LiaF [Ureibacillus thermophilus]QBK25749.1 hypothetical protein DKZ56_07655 [Ureibacillus thermophilus]